LSSTSEEASEQFLAVERGGQGRKEEDRGGGGGQGREEGDREGGGGQGREERRRRDDSKHGHGT